MPTKPDDFYENIVEPFIKEVNDLSSVEIPRSVGKNDKTTQGPRLTGIIHNWGEYESLQPYPNY